MEIFQRISIKGKGSPFTKPLSIAPTTLIDEMRCHGFVFEEFDRWSINYDAVYLKGEYEKITQIVKTLAWDVDVSRQFWNTYSEADYDYAPLWKTYFPDLWIDEIDFTKNCNECGCKRREVNTDFRIPSVKSKNPFHNVNGQFDIVSAEVMLSMADSGLSGASFFPFDEQFRYFYLRSSCILSSLIIKEDEVIDFNGYCSTCNFPKFKVFLGPTRYAKSDWSGEDIVLESFFQGCLISPKAFNLFRSFDQNLCRDISAILE